MLTVAIKVRTRPRDRDEPDYVREETYIERGKGPGPRNAELVYRGRDDSIEDIPRDFPPGYRRGGNSRDYDDYDAPRRSKSAAGSRRYSDDDDRYTDYAAGGAAGYAAGRGRDRDHRRRDDRDYDSEYSRSPPRRERKKSGVGELVESLGLGGLIGGVLGNKDKGRDSSPGGRSARSRSRGGRSRRGYSSDRSDRSRSRGPGDKSKSERKWAQAAQAALVAGAVEAFRSRQEPGPWTGAKGRRIATAALGAGGIDGLIDRDPEKKSKRHLAEAVIGGLAANRLANGPRSKSQVRGADSRDVSPDSRAPRSRSRSVIDRLRGRSQSRGRAPDEQGGGTSGALKGLVGAGALAAAGKAVFDRVRSKSRKRRSPSRSSSADSYVPSRRRARDRRRSPRSDTGSTHRTDGASDRGDQGGREVARGTNGGSALAPAAAGGAAGALARRSQSRGGGGGDGNESSDSSSTTDMEKTRKKMRGKELITAGLATVATIHAAHGVYSSMEAHEKRHRLVAEGEMTPEEARKKQTKAWIQDAAAVGIAALGIKGAFSEWKEMNEQRYCLHSFLREIHFANHHSFPDAKSKKSRSGRRNVERSALLGKSKRNTTGTNA